MIDPVALWEADSIEVDGIGIAVYRTTAARAHAPTIVMLHGLGHWATGSWSAVAGLLHQHANIIAIDLPGFGDSDKPDVAYDLDFYTAVCGNALRQLTSGPFFLVGHSLGGLISASIAANDPTIVNGLALVSPAAFRVNHPWVIAFLGNQMSAPVFQLPPSRWFVRRTLYRTVNDPRSMDVVQFQRTYDFLSNPLVRRTCARIYAAAIRELDDLPRLHECLARFRGPVQAVLGILDPYIPPSAAEAIQFVYPQARLTLLERCRHIAQLEYPPVVAARIVELLATSRP